MKKLFLIQIALMLGAGSMAQQINYEWARSMGGTSRDQGNSVIADKSGNVYTTGLFTGKTDFDPDTKDTFYLTSNGGTDIYISKLDANGKFVWAVNIGGSSDDAGNSVNLDASGNVLVTGYFQDKLDFDPGSGSKVLTSAGKKDIFVCKFNSSGNLVWADQIGGTADDAGNGIDVDAGGSSYATGFFNDKVDFDPGSTATNYLTSAGGTDIFVLRLDANGNHVWAGQMGGTSDDAGNGIALDSFGYVYATGFFKGQADFDPDPKATAYLTSNADADIFVLRLDGKGVYQWAHLAGESGADIGYGIAVDAVGNNYSTGHFYGSPDFDPGTGKGQVYTLTSNGDYDIYVWKLDASGAFLWAKNMGGKYDDKGMSIALDASKNVYTTGTYSDASDFDPGSSSTKTLTSAGKWDAFISKLDVSGNYDVAYSIGDIYTDIGTGIYVDRSKSVYTTGSYMSTVDFDPGSGTVNLSSAGNEDAFVQKMSVCKASYYDIPVTACNSYFYKGTTYYKGGDYISYLKNSTGCDSVVTLKLKLNTSTVQTLNIGACDSYTLNGQTYTTAGSYTQTLKNVAGCDSFLVLELKFLTNSSTLNAKACNSYTLNSQTYTNTGKYTQVVTNKAGCDSTITLNLTIVVSTSSNIKATACNSYKLVGTTYTKSGIYTQVEKNEAGCDSTITLDLTINTPTAETINKDACSSYTLNAQTYAKSGVYTQLLPNTKGCDSTITLNLSINNSSSVINATGCQKYILNGQTYTSSGTYNQTITNTKGCDSAITLNLKVNTVVTTVTKAGTTLTSDEPLAAYQWIDCNKGNADINGEIGQSYTPKVTGDYAVKVTKNSCTDSSTCINVLIASVGKLQGNSISVFPNPTNGEARIICSNSLNNGTLKVIDITGQVLFEKTNLSGNILTLNLSDEAKGIYFVEISQDGNVSRVKLVKN